MGDGGRWWPIQFRISLESLPLGASPSRWFLTIVYPEVVGAVGVPNFPSLTAPQRAGLARANAVIGGGAGMLSTAGGAGGGTMTPGCAHAISRRDQQLCK